MRGTPQQSSIVASPILIGAVTVLVAVVGVFLSYNANQGLPFVPTYDITVRVPDSAGLVKGNEVRVGGKRVGVVNEIRAVPGRTRPIAELDLKLDKTIEPLHDDSLIAVRPRSPLGLKYLELTRGKHGKDVAHGGTLPLSAAKTIVELDQVQNALDAPTRSHLASAVTELGNGLAGRGVDFNGTVAESPLLLARLVRVARVLAAPDTGLGRTIRAAARTATEVDPVYRQVGSFVTAARVTTGALASVRGELGDALGQLPPTEQVGIRALHVARPVLHNARLLLHDISPGIRVLPLAARRLDSAIDRGIPVLRRASDLSDRLRSSLHAVDELSSDPLTVSTLDRLNETLRVATPDVRFLAPLQVRCNYISLFGRNAASLLSEGDPSGSWFRTLPVAAVDEAIGGRADLPPNIHVNQYAFTGQNGECEAGNEPYLPGQRVGHVPGNQGSSTETTSPPPETRRR